MRVPGTDQWRIEMADVIAGQDAAIGWNRLTETDAIYSAGGEKYQADQVPTDVAENTLWNLISPREPYARNANEFLNFRSSCRHPGYPDLPFF